MSEDKEIYTYQLKNIDKLNIIDAALGAASTPEQAKGVETLAAVAHAYYRETSDYESAVEAMTLYIKARRKTTELCVQYAPPHGGDRGKNQYGEWQIKVDSNLPFAFTHSQWQRRTKELSVPDEILDQYIDDCISKHVEPSLAGMLRFAADPFGEVERRESRIIKALHGLLDVFEREMKFRYNATQPEHLSDARSDYRDAWKYARKVMRERK